MKNIKTTLVCVSLLVSLNSACVSTTTYHAYDETSQADDSSRSVAYTVNKSFYRALPSCVIVLPAIGLVKSYDKMIIERAAARHLRGKITRVIGPIERRKLARRLALDLTSKSDRQYLSSYRLQGRSCRYFAVVTVFSIEESFAVIWAGRRVHLGLEITHGNSGDSLWKAEHSSSRSDGGLPLTPFSLGASAWRAGQVTADKDMFPSMIDDVFRRILVTLPDIRNF